MSVLSTLMRAFPVERLSFVASGPTEHPSPFCSSAWLLEEDLWPYRDWGDGSYSVSCSSRDQSPAAPPSSGVKNCRAEPRRSRRIPTMLGRDGAVASGQARSGTRFTRPSRPTHSGLHLLSDRNRVLLISGPRGVRDQARLQPTTRASNQQPESMASSRPARPNRATSSDMSPRIRRIDHPAEGWYVHWMRMTSPGSTRSCSNG